MTHTIEVTGPVGQQVTAQWVEFPARRLAVIEMASCAGLSLVPQDLRDPGATTILLAAHIRLRGFRVPIPQCLRPRRSPRRCRSCFHPRQSAPLLEPVVRK